MTHDRRDFVQHVGGLTLGVAGMAGLDLDRLTALLPQADPTGTRHVGAADVAVIEQAKAAFVRWDFASGAGPVRDLAVAQLRSVLPLLGAEMAPEVRPRLYLATASLGDHGGLDEFRGQPARRCPAAVDDWDRGCPRRRRPPGQQPHCLPAL